jgi:hypothetical protein
LKLKLDPESKTSRVGFLKGTGALLQKMFEKGTKGVRGRHGILGNEDRQ